MVTITPVANPQTPPPSKKASSDHGSNSTLKAPEPSVKAQADLSQHESELFVLLPLGGDAKGQRAATSDEIASLQSSFSHLGTATDFLRAYGCVPKFIAIVHHYGSILGLLAAARNDYIKAH